MKFFYRHKRQITAVLVVCMVLLLFSPMIAYAATEEVKGTYFDGTYDEDTGDITLTETEEGSSSDAGLLGSTLSTVILDWTVKGYEAISTWVSLAIPKMFNPNFNQLIRIENGSMLAKLATETNDIEGVRFLHRFWSVSVGGGVVLGTAIFFLNMAYIVAGKSKQIKDTPQMLMVRYLTSLVLIYLSKSVIAGFITIFDSIWTKVVCFAIQRQAENIFPPITSVFGIAYNQFRNAIIMACIPLVGLIVAIKLIKTGWQTFKQIFMKYLLLMILLACFPLAIGMIVSVQTEQFFKDYIRMMVSELITMGIACVIFSVFVEYTVYGLWTTTVMGFMMLCAFAQIAGQIDQMFARLGLNAANTATAAFGKKGSLIMGLSSMSQLIKNGDRLRSNVGKGLITAGVASSDSAKGLRLVNRGMKLQESMATRVASTLAGGSDTTRSAMEFMDKAVADNAKWNSSIGPGTKIPYDPTRSFGDNAKAAGIAASQFTSPDGHLLPFVQEKMDTMNAKGENRYIADIQHGEAGGWFALDQNGKALFGADTNNKAVFGQEAEIFQQGKEYKDAQRQLDAAKQADVRNQAAEQGVAIDTSGRQAALEHTTQNVPDKRENGQPLSENVKKAYVNYAMQSQYTQEFSNAVHAKNGNTSIINPVVADSWTNQFNNLPIDESDRHMEGNFYANATGDGAIFYDQHGDVYGIGRLDEFTRHDAPDFQQKADNYVANMAAPEAWGVGKTQTFTEGQSLVRDYGMTPSAAAQVSAAGGVRPGDTILQGSRGEYVISRGNDTVMTVENRQGKQISPVVTQGEAAEMRRGELRDKWDKVINRGNNTGHANKGPRKA